MRDQRWPMDDETIRQEFRYSRREEEMGMHENMMSYGNDHMATRFPTRLDRYETDELSPSWTTQLDTNGMQPHSREYLERDVTAMRSARKYSMIDGQHIDHCDGIHFDGCP